LRARNESTDRRRRRGIRRGDAIADEPGEMDGEDHFRCVRDATRDAIDARRERTRRSRHLVRHIDARSRLNRTARHDRGRDARRARVQRENRTKRLPHHPIAFARVACRPTASSHRASTGTAPSRLPRRGGAPLCFFSSPPAKIFGASDARRRVHRWRVRPGASLVDVPTRRARITNAGFRGTKTRSRRPRSSRGDRRRDRRARDDDRRDAGGIARRAKCVRASTHFCQSRTRVERISRVTVREPSTPSVGPRSRRARAGPDSYEWAGIITVHDPSFSVLIFSHFSPKDARVRGASRLRLCFVCIHSRRARLPHTASRRRSTIDANGDRDRSRKNSIDANPRSERLERGRASTQRTRETTRAGAEKKTRREEIPDDARDGRPWVTRRDDDERWYSDAF